MKQLICRYLACLYYVYFALFHFRGSRLKIDDVRDLDSIFLQDWLVYIKQKINRKMSKKLTLFLLLGRNSVELAFLGILAICFLICMHGEMCHLKINPEGLILAFNCANLV